MANPGNDIIMAKDKPIDMGFIIKQLSQEKSPTLDGKPKLIFVQVKIKECLNVIMVPTAL